MNFTFKNETKAVLSESPLTRLSIDSWYYVSMLGHNLTLMHEVPEQGEGQNLVRLFE